jgi:zinc/manganese transport system permease protein
VPSADDLLWLAAPCLALMAACAALVPLGAQVLSRGVVFIDLAVAQIAACGALAAAVFVDHPARWITGSASALAALVGSGVVWALSRAWPAQREALIGLVYVCGASFAVVGASLEPHGRERLTELLAAAVVWLARGSTPRLAHDAVFYGAFALTLSVAVSSLGLYLVFAMLIGPALWTRRTTSLPAAFGLAVLACAGGIGLSWAFDWPSGACVAMALSGLGLGVTLFSRGT